MCSAGPDSGLYATPTPGEWNSLIYPTTEPKDPTQRNARGENGEGEDEDGNRL